MSSVAKENGLIFFDIWNSECPSVNLPHYDVQTMSFVEVERLLQKYDLRLIKSSYGFAFPQQFRRTFHLLLMIFGATLGARLAWLLFEKITSHFKSANKGQNLFFLATKNTY